MDKVLLNVSSNQLGFDPKVKEFAIPIVQNPDKQIGVLLEVRNTLTQPTPGIRGSNQMPEGVGCFSDSYA